MYSRWKRVDFDSEGGSAGDSWATADRGAARTALEQAFAEPASARFQEGIAWALDLMARGDRPTVSRRPEPPGRL